LPGPIPWLGLPQVEYDKDFEEKLQQMGVRAFDEFPIKGLAGLRAAGRGLHTRPLFSST